MKCKVLERIEKENTQGQKVRIDLNHWTYDHRPDRPEIFVSLSVTDLDSMELELHTHIHVLTISEGMVLLHALGNAQNIS